jgi:hypothetical protein
LCFVLGIVRNDVVAYELQRTKIEGPDA